MWCWTKCSSSKTWVKNTGKQSSVSEGELDDPNEMKSSFPTSYSAWCWWKGLVSVRYFCVSSSEQRVLLINTPLQNTLKELWTMIHFLLPGITRPFSDFPVKAGTDQNQDYCHKLVIRLHRVGTMTVSTSAPFNCSTRALKTFSLLNVGDPAFHPEALQKGRGETAAEEVRAHPKVPSLQQAKEPLRRYPHSAGVRWPWC